MFPDLIDTRPLRRAIDDGLEWVVRNWGDEFEAAAYPLLMLLKAIEDLLIATPWWLIMAILVGIAWLATRNWKLPAIVLVSLLFLGVMDLWKDAMTTMALMIAATITAIVVSIPVGVWMSRSPTVRNIITPILDLMQTLPSFVYLVPVVMFFGLGNVSALFATFVYAVPPLIRLTDLGLRSVDRSLVEAAQTAGATEGQVLRYVRLPLALPTLAAGVNQTIMLALSMVVLTSMIGARGLGQVVLRGLQRGDVGLGLEAGLAIVLLAVVMDRVTAGYARRWDPDAEERG